jgi:hypothetical protein
MLHERNGPITAMSSMVMLRARQMAVMFWRNTMRENGVAFRQQSVENWAGLQGGWTTKRGA